MIRINLLPRSQRRRRWAPKRETVALASMVLGWALVTSAGYMWIEARRGRVAELRSQVVAVEEATQKARAGRQHAALAARQDVLRARRESLELLRAERRTPLQRIRELDRLFAAEGLDLLEVREQDGVWRVVGEARDPAVLGDLVRRVRASDRMRPTGGPAYVRTAEERLRFDMTLALLAWD